MHKETRKLSLLGRGYVAASFPTQKKRTTGFVPASDASNRIAAIHADASFNGIAGGLDSDEPGFNYFLIYLTMFTC